MDGKRDTTLETEKLGSKSYKKVNEEHISIVIEPCSQHAGILILKLEVHRIFLLRICCFSVTSGLAPENFAKKNPVNISF